MRCVFLDAQTLTPVALSENETSKTAQACDLDWAGLYRACDDVCLHPATSSAELQKRLADADIVISNKVPLTAKDFAEHPKLAHVAVAATGVDAIDIHAAQKVGVAVSHVQNYGSMEVAQHVWALLLALAGSLPRYLHGVRQGDWSRSKHFCRMDHPVVALAGKTLGIVGYGHIGSAVAKMGHAMGMRVLVAQSLRDVAQDQKPSNMDGEDVVRTPWPEFWAQSDVVSLHLPLNAQTLGMVDAKALAQMPKGGFLINCARGALVQSEALIAALDAGHLAGAGLDTLDCEPPAAEHPLLQAQARLPQLLITPHCAWVSRRARQEILNQVVANVVAWQNGKKLRRVV